MHTQLTKAQKDILEQLPWIPSWLDELRLHNAEVDMTQQDQKKKKKTTKKKEAVFGAKRHAQFGSGDLAMLGEKKGKTAK